MSHSGYFSGALADLWTRDGIAPHRAAVIAHEVATLFASGSEGARTASQLLARSGIRRRWNEVLQQDRSATIASKIESLVDGPLLDVLSGDGSICRALHALGITRLAATERPGDYAETVMPPHVRFEPFTETLDFSIFNASTALLSTVLHHETDATALLDQLSRSSVQRWIVVENCLTREFPRDFHEWADRFFNSCLNEFGIPCGDQHRTLEEWRALLGRYGTVEVIDEAFDVPGIWFPYTLFLVRRHPGATISTLTERE